MIRIALTFASAGLLAACATSQPGWTGTGAEPFGTAETECKAAVAAIPDPGARDSAFDQCMARKGWTRS